MGKGIFNRLLDNVERAGTEAPEFRKSGHNRKYRLPDAIKNAFAVFFFMHQSMLNFQRAMKARRKRSKMETLFGVTDIPGDTQIRILADAIAPAVFAGVFRENLKTADAARVLDTYRVLAGGVLRALDGLGQYSSKKIHSNTVCTSLGRERQPSITARWPGR
jgi:hypothetical protein